MIELPTGRTQSQTLTSLADIESAAQFTGVIRCTAGERQGFAIVRDGHTSIVFLVLFQASYKGHVLVAEATTGWSRNGHG